MLLRCVLLCLLLSFNSACCAKEARGVIQENPSSKHNNNIPETNCSYQSIKDNPQFFRNAELPLNPQIVDLLQKQVNKDLHILVFLGTWCADSRNIVPLFFNYLEKANWSIGTRLNLFCVDHNKRISVSGLENLAQSLKINKVPTIIFLKDGKEIQRIVEYGLPKNEIHGLPSQNWENVFAKVLEGL